MSEITLTIENVGGIDRLETTIDEGPSLVTGENASNKTSLLRAVLFGFGAEDVPIKTDAETATVELSFESRTVTRSATRTDRGVSVSGEPWIEDDDGALLFERFAGLLETNPLRTAVQTNADVETLLKEPMDIDAIEREQSRKLERKRDLQRRVDGMEDVGEELAARREELRRRKDEVESLSAELEDLYDEVPRDDELADLRDRRSNLAGRRDRLQAQVEDVESAIERIEERTETLSADLEDARETAAEFDLPSMRSERESLRESVAEIEERVETLQSVLTANREMLGSDMRGVLEYEAGLDGDTAECWACGQDADTSSFEETTERLADLVEREKEKRREYHPEIREIEERIERAESATREVDRLEGELQSAESKLESRRESLEKKREQLSAVEKQLAAVDEEIEETQEELAADQSAVSKDIEEKRASLEAKRRDVERLEREVDDLEDRTDERERLREEIDDLTADIRELTDRIENLESHLRGAFNEAMDDLIDALGFERVERMWLDGDFDLVIARHVGGGVREDSPENLAESEREMIGLVLGLAGYLAYDVDEAAPVLLLDSLGAFDADRTRRLVNYFSDHADVFLAAIHPEQAVDLDEEFRSIAPSRAV
jgi:chromosome segregation ATPase